MGNFTFVDLMEEKNHALCSSGIFAEPVKIKYAVIKDILCMFKDEDNATAYARAFEERDSFYTPQGFPVPINIIYQAIEELEKIKDEITEEEYNSVYE